MKYKDKELLSIFLTIMMLGLAFLKMGLFFETNDDRIIGEMLAGTITKEPNAHVQVINYLLAAPLSWLYKITWKVPWYGICLLLFHGISWEIIFESILSCSKKIYEVVVGTGICGSLFLINLYTTGLVQFTSTACLMAMAGYVCIVLQQTSKTLYKFVFLEFIAFLLRSEAMLMIQPLGLAVFMGFYVSKHQWKQAEKRKFLYKAGISVVGVVLIGMAGNWIGYFGTEWREYNKYNKARIALFDYYGAPDYEDVKNILDKYQVTKVDYEAYCAYVTVGGNISAECVEELADFAKDKRDNTADIYTLLQRSLGIIHQEDSLACSRLIGIMWISALIWVVVSGSFYLLYPIVALGVARTGVWCYLFYKGRILNRVSYPLFFCEIIFLLILVISSYVDSKKNNWQKFIISLICVVFIINGYKIGQAQYRYVCSINEGQAIYIEGLKEIKKYCMCHPERRYFLDSASFSFYKGSILEADIYEPGNGMYTGGWSGNSPVIREYFREYCGDEWKDFYLIVYDDGNLSSVQSEYITVRYFVEKSGREPSISDRFSTSHGGSYIVWHF